MYSCLSENIETITTANVRISKEVGHTLLQDLIPTSVKLQFEYNLQVNNYPTLSLLRCRAWLSTESSSTSSRTHLTHFAWRHLKFIHLLGGKRMLFLREYTELQHPILRNQNHGDKLQKGIFNTNHVNLMLTIIQKTTVHPISRLNSAAQLASSPAVKTSKYH